MQTKIGDFLFELWLVPAADTDPLKHQGKGEFFFTNPSENPTSITIHYFKTKTDTTIQIAPLSGGSVIYSQAEMQQKLQINLGVSTGGYTGQKAGVKTISSPEKVFADYWHDAVASKEIYT